MLSWKGRAINCSIRKLNKNGLKMLPWGVPVLMLQEKNACVVVSSWQPLTLVVDYYLMVNVRENPYLPFGIVVKIIDRV